MSISPPEDVSGDAQSDAQSTEYSTSNNCNRKKVRSVGEKSGSSEDFSGSHEQKRVIGKECKSLLRRDLKNTHLQL